MQKSSVPVVAKVFLIIFVIIIIIASYLSYRYNKIYNSITVEVSNNKKLEYGSANYDIEDLLDNVSGNVVSVIKNVDINIVGEQEVILEVEKKNIVKEIPIVVEVVDSVKPEITLKEDVVTINSGIDYDLLNNIASVTDAVDGNIDFKISQDVKENDINYYTINGSVNTNLVGTNEVEVKAVDKCGNVSTKSFQVKVISHGKEKTLSSIAYSLLGSPYVSGGTSPSGFDCSGFVQYVYARSGIKISRSASTQLYDGYEVSYSNAKPGDILVWGYGRDNITHTGIYVGNGRMIHAANPNEGVVVNNVATWGNWSGLYVVSVRRLI